MTDAHRLKPISREAIPAALEKAQRYRLLNQPHQAESICLDILATQPKHPEALVTLLLALTDQFPRALQPAHSRAVALLNELADPYAKAYYEGVIHERRGKAHLRSGAPMAGSMAFEWIRRAMASYERAEGLRRPGDDDAVLRWNSCVRMLTDHPEMRAHPEPEPESMLE